MTLNTILAGIVASSLLAMAMIALLPVSQSQSAQLIAKPGEHVVVVHKSPVLQSPGFGPGTHCAPPLCQDI